MECISCEMDQKLLSIIMHSINSIHTIDTKYRAHSLSLVLKLGRIIDAFVRVRFCKCLSLCASLKNRDERAKWAFSMENQISSVNRVTFEPYVTDGEYLQILYVSFGHKLAKHSKYSKYTCIIYQIKQFAASRLVSGGLQYT